MKAGAPPPLRIGRMMPPPNCRSPTLCHSTGAASIRGASRRTRKERLRPAQDAVCQQSDPLVYRRRQHPEVPGEIEVQPPGIAAFRPIVGRIGDDRPACRPERSEEHTSELQSLMRISYAVFCLKKKKKQQR